MTLKSSFISPAGRRPGLPGITYILALAIVLLVVVQLIGQPRFGTYQNIANVSRMAALLALISVGQMFVVVTRGFDLSIGANMALSSIVVATVLSQLGLEAALIPTALTALAVALVVGAAIGALNGVIVTGLKVHSFIVTMGVASVLVGATQWFTDGVPIYGIPRSFVTDLGRSAWLGMPSFLWVAGTVIVLLGLMFGKTFIGKYIMAVGRDERSAKLSGIKTQLYVVLSYALCGGCAALASLLLTAQLGSGQPTMGAVYAFQSIAVCVIGGISLAGGKGSVVNVVLAALLMQLLSNSLELLRMPSQAQAIVAGAIVVLIAVLNLKGKD